MNASDASVGELLRLSGVEVVAALTAGLTSSPTLPLGKGEVRRGLEEEPSPPLLKENSGVFPPVEDKPAAGALASEKPVLIRSKGPARMDTPAREEGL
jgi:hypothetical protein